MSITIHTDSIPVDAALQQLVADRVASRLFAGDPTLWGAEAEAEASIRLGWTHIADRAFSLIPEIEALREELALQGVDRVVLCGMGGSSLAPEVITKWAGVPLTVLDSTHPDQVSRTLTTELARSVVVVSSKSGSTIETRSHRAAYAAAFHAAGIDPATRIIIVTDPGSPLEADARQSGQRVFLADPEVGGRYSALTAFGLVPSGLAGADIARLVDEALAVRDKLSEDHPSNPGLRLSAAIAAGLPDTYALGLASTADADWGLGDWIEQLIAESTGKHARGVLPVVLSKDAPEICSHTPEAMIVATVSSGFHDADTQTQDTPPDHCAAQQHHRATISVSAPLGAQLLLWESATAVLGRLMNINPFDQPDVESAKVAARAVLSATTVRPAALSTFTIADSLVEVVASPGTPPTSIVECVTALRHSLSQGGYLAVQAYLDREGGAAQQLHELRAKLASSLKVPVSVGWGPRFLHSTGQLHKGGPAIGTFMQLLDDPHTHVDIDGIEGGFTTLISAQAEGDRTVLSAGGNSVFAFRAADPETMMRALTQAL